MKREKDPHIFCKNVISFKYFPFTDMEANWFPSGINIDAENNFMYKVSNVDDAIERLNIMQILMRGSWLTRLNVHTMKFCISTLKKMVFRMEFPMTCACKFSVVMWEECGIN